MSVQKIFTVATTEFGTAVRSKAFLIGLLLLPIIMGASIFLQKFMAEQVDTTPRNFAVIDRTGTLFPVIARPPHANNQTLIDDQGKQRRPAFQPIEIKPPDAEAAVPDHPARPLRQGPQGRTLRLRRTAPTTSSRPGGSAMSYYSNTPNDSLLRDWLNGIVSTEIRSTRFRDSGIDQQLADAPE